VHLAIGVDFGGLKRVLRAVRVFLHKNKEDTHQQ